MSAIAAIRNGSTIAGSPIAVEAELDQPREGQADRAAPAGRQAVDRAADQQAGGGADQGDADEGEQQRADPAAGIGAAREPQSDDEDQRQQQADRRPEQHQQEVGGPGAGRAHPVADRAGRRGVERGIARPIADQGEQGEQRAEGQSEPAEQGARALGRLAQPVPPLRQPPGHFAPSLPPWLRAPNVPDHVHAPARSPRSRSGPWSRARIRRRDAVTPAAAGRLQDRRKVGPASWSARTSSSSAAAWSG